MAQIEVNGLSFDYSIEDKVLKNVNLIIEKGDFICIVGENGSGKSTLLKCIAGLNKVSKEKIKVNSNIGYLPQKSNIQRNFPASVEEVILSGTTDNSIFKIIYSKKEKDKVEKIMKELNLYDLRKKCFKDLSGGQQQRVLIARALCSSDEILILDEPTNGLDPVIARQIYRLLKNLNEKNNITIIMVSHDTDRAISYSKRVIEMKNGKKVFDGSSEEYLSQGDKVK